MGIDKRFESLESRMERGFAAVAEDIADIRLKMATKEELRAEVSKLATKEDVRRVEMKVEGVEKRLDFELDKRGALEVRVNKFEAKLAR